MQGVVKVDSQAEAKPVSEAAPEGKKGSVKQDPAIQAETADKKPQHLAEVAIANAKKGKRKGRPIAAKSATKKVRRSRFWDLSCEQLRLLSCPYV